MNDINVILDGIRRDAEKDLVSLKESSDAEYKALLEKNEAALSSEDEKNKKLLSEKLARLSASAASSADSAYSRKILEIKSREIEKKIEKFLSDVTSLPDTEYFACLAELCGVYAEEREATVFLSEKDLGRDVSLFKKELEKYETPERKFILSDSPACGIKTGCVVSYGKIEENLSWESILEAKKDDIKDALYSAIYGENK